MSNVIEPVTQDRPFRIQTPAGYRKYLCSGLYMPSVTTVLSATESEKSKAGLRTWQKNNPGALEEAAPVVAIHLGCENYFVVLILVCLNNIKVLECISTYLDWFDVLHWSERPCVLTGTTYVATTVRLPTSGLPSTCMPVALT